jgi:hypothetical protein
MKVAYGTVGLNHRQMLFVPLFVSGILYSRTGQSREAIDALTEILVDMCGMDEDEMLRGGKMVAKIPGEPMFIPRELIMMTRSIDTNDPNSHLFPLHLDKHIHFRHPLRCT